jgi:hypothetical protein
MVFFSNGRKDFDYISIIYEARSPKYNYVGGILKKTYMHQGPTGEMSILLKPALPVGRTSLLFGIQQSRMVV